MFFQLFIEIDDANDNAPQFLEGKYFFVNILVLRTFLFAVFLKWFCIFQIAQYSVDLPENSPVQTSLIQLHCTDADSGNNGKFNFVVKSGIDQVFATTSVASSK